MTDLADLIERNADIFRRVIVNRAEGAHGFIPKYAMSGADEAAFERAGYMTNFSSSVYMLTDRGRALVAALTA